MGSEDSTHSQSASHTEEQANQSESRIKGTQLISDSFALMETHMVKLFSQALGKATCGFKCLLFLNNFNTFLKGLMLINVIKELQKGFSYYRKLLFFYYHFYKKTMFKYITFNQEFNWSILKPVWIHSGTIPDGHQG